MDGILVSLFKFQTTFLTCTEQTPENRAAKIFASISWAILSFSWHSAIFLTNNKTTCEIFSKKALLKTKTLTKQSRSFNKALPSKKHSSFFPCIQKKHNKPFASFPLLLIAPHSKPSSKRA